MSKLLVAVSGGPDSLALLLVLRELRQEFGFELEACHFDHQLHDGSQEARDQVRAICERLGVECVTGEGDVRSVASRNGQSIEEAARMMRYQFLAFVAGKEGCDAIAVGHTADDQAETVLMRIVRGSGVRGIRGMLPSSPVPGSPAQRLVRPLLQLSRQETEAVCSEAGVEPIRDPSNDDAAYQRNVVRHETLAALRKLNPSVDDALRGLAASAREVFAGVEREAMAIQPRQRTAWGAVFSRDALAGLQAEALVLVVEREASFFQLRPEINRTRVKNLGQVLTRGTGEVRLGEVVVEASCGLARIGPTLDDSEAFDARVLNVPGVTPAGGWRIQVSTDSFEPSPAATDAAVDASRIRGALRARPLRPGDRMPYHGFDRLVSDVFSNAKAPRWERASAFAVADAERVHAVFAASQALSDNVQGEDAWYVRVSPAPAR